MTRTILALGMYILFILMGAVFMALGLFFGMFENLEKRINSKNIEPITELREEVKQLKSNYCVKFYMDNYK